MLDIRLIRENPELVKENLKKKFQEHKLGLVDEAIELDEQLRAAICRACDLRASRNALSKEIGKLMGMAKKNPEKLCEAEALKNQVLEDAKELCSLKESENTLKEKLRAVMLRIPQIIDEKVPIGRDDSENVEIERFGEPLVPDFEIPYHTDIMESFYGIDLDSARRVSGQGFYYLQGDIARLHSAVLSYARDFMIDKGFCYVIPPFMIRSAMVEGVMSFEEMDAMMYKIEGEDLYLIGTSEHSMIARYNDTILDEDELPLNLTSYTPASARKKARTVLRSAASTEYTSSKSRR